MGKFNYSLAYLTWILLGLLPSLGKLYILTNCKIIKTRPRTFFRHMVIKIVWKVWTLGNYNYASITFVDRLIRKSIANSAFALSLILESNTLRRQSVQRTHSFFLCKNRSEKFSPVTTTHKKWKYNLTFQKLCQNTFLYLRKSNVYIAQKIVPFPFPLSWPSIAY